MMSSMVKVPSSTLMSKTSEATLIIQISQPWKMINGRPSKALLLKVKGMEKVN